MLEPITRCGLSWEIAIESLVETIFYKKCFFPSYNFNVNDGIIIQPTNAGKIPYLFVNILWNSVVILLYPETWGLEQKIPREWDDDGHQGLALLTAAVAMYNQVLDFGLLWLDSPGLVWRGLFCVCGFPLLSTYSGFEGLRIEGLKIPGFGSLW